MLLEVKSRSPESWGPLAKVGDREFNRIINNRKGNTKDLIKKAKKLKTYKVRFKKVWESDYFEILAENDYSVGSVARAYFKANESKIGFKEPPRSKWADGYAGYDTLSYVKVK
jgi:hypothetical protein